MRWEKGTFGGVPSQTWEAYTILTKDGEHHLTYSKDGEGHSVLGHYKSLDAAKKAARKHAAMLDTNHGHGGSTRIYPDTDVKPAATGTWGKPVSDPPLARVSAEGACVLVEVAPGVFRMPDAKPAYAPSVTITFPAVDGAIGYDAHRLSFGVPTGHALTPAMLKRDRVESAIKTLLDTWKDDVQNADVFVSRGGTITDIAWKRILVDFLDDTHERVTASVSARLADALREVAPDVMMDSLDVSGWIEAGLKGQPAPDAPFLETSDFEAEDETYEGVDDDSMRDLEEKLLSLVLPEV